MSKHKCGTCRFYREADFAASGWCHHPERRKSNNALIMVRRGELACRDGWDHDLWSPRAGGDGAPREGGFFPARPERPASSAEIAAVARLRAEPEPAPGGALHEDIVVGQAPIMPSPDDRVALLAYDTRTAIMEARERARRRLAAQAAEPVEAPKASAATPEPTGAAAAASDAPAPAPTSPNTADDDESGTPLDHREHVVAHDDIDVPPESVALPLARQADPLPDRFEAIPVPIADVALPRADPRPSRVRVRSGDVLAVAEDEADWLDEPFGPGEARRSRLLSEVLARRARDAERHLEPMDRQAETRPAPRARDVASPSSIPAVHEEPHRFQPGPAPVAEQPVVAHDDSDEPWGDGVDAPADDVVPEAAPAPRQVVARRPKVAGRDEIDDELLDMTVQVAPQVPRMCQTCRDYRPAESGERGWCTNKWAFSHRRMVDQDELPCHTSLGCWWLPHDDVWLDTADISAHSQPTPLLDRWLAEEREAAVGEERGRQPLRRHRS